MKGSGVLMYPYLCPLRKPQTLLQNRPSMILGLEIRCVYSAIATKRKNAIGRYAEDVIVPISRTCTYR